ncbi:MAG: hypothetical protein Q8K89_04190 [Actinomycetota bacterium]|nr:hypothetical protein [Actinomycetota bacterium]
MGTLYERLEELHHILELLTVDLQHLKPLLGERSVAVAHTQTEHALRRSYVRAFFALVEALVEQQARLLVALQDSGFVKLSPGMRDALTDTTYDVKTNGIVYERSMRLPLKSKIRALYRAASEVLDEEIAVPFDDQGWGDFGAALKVRHALTHPKTPNDCYVEDEDLDVVDRAQAWHQNAHNELTEAMRMHRNKHGW